MTSGHRLLRDLLRALRAHARSSSCSFGVTGGVEPPVKEGRAGRASSSRSAPAACSARSVPTVHVLVLVHVLGHCACALARALSPEKQAASVRRTGRSSCTSTASLCTCTCTDHDAETLALTRASAASVGCSAELGGRAQDAPGTCHSTRSIWISSGSSAKSRSCGVASGMKP
jgi:hypothetical protein